jgi:hypothetical protein
MIFNTLYGAGVLDRLGPGCSSGSGFVAVCVPQTFRRPSELNLSIVQFLPNGVFNANHFLRFCICSMRISCRDKWEAKCRPSEDPKLSVCLF